MTQVDEVQTPERLFISRHLVFTESYLKVTASFSINYLANVFQEWLGIHKLDGQNLGITFGGGIIGY